MYLYYIDIFKALSYKLYLIKPSLFKFYGGIQHITLGVFCVFSSLRALQGLRDPKKYIWIYSISPFEMTTCVTLCFSLKCFSSYQSIVVLWRNHKKNCFAQRITIFDDQECNSLLSLLNAFQAISQPLCFARIKKNSCAKRHNTKPETVIFLC